MDPILVAFIRDLIRDPERTLLNLSQQSPFFNNPRLCHASSMTMNLKEVPGFPPRVEFHRDPPYPVPRGCGWNALPDFLAGRLGDLNDPVGRAGNGLGDSFPNKVRPSSYPSLNSSSFSSSSP